MICERCGHSMPDGSLTCEICGTYLGKYANASTTGSGVKGIRQGRTSSVSPTLPPQPARNRVYGDYDLSAVPINHRNEPMRKKPVPAAQGDRGSSRPRARRGVPKNAYGRAPQLHSRGARVYNGKSRDFNWMRLWVILAVIVLAGGIGLWYYEKNSESGQRKAARRNALAVTEGMFELAVTKEALLQEDKEALLRDWNEVSPQAYWLAGQDFLDVGDVEHAILSFRLGDVVAPDNYDGLLLLANAYELNAQDDLAEALYARLAEDVSPSRTEAYTALIRLFQAQERRPEAAEMMRKAYENTDRDSFRLEREDYIPEMPKTSLNAGRYEIGKLEGNVHLTSPQGYDIYYTTDDAAVLPGDGLLSEDGSFVPSEGSVTLRAVCVSEDLVSDEMKVGYTFYYPTPPQPRSSLAPNSYKKPIDIWLKPGQFIDETRTKKEMAEDEKHYRYFYTIDGSTPTENSPAYDGTPIKMPVGRVTLKAICLNQYNKSSSVMEIKYKFEGKPAPLEVYGEGDVFAGFVIGKTTIDQFKSSFGEPLEELPTNYLGLANQAVHLNYDWGYAVFMLDGSAWELVRIEMNRALGNAPRGVGFGSTEEEITAVYKDFGQLPSANGERGLYYDYPRVGAVRVLENGARMVQYSCQTVSGDIWMLQYHLQNGRVSKICHYYQP